MSYAQNQMIHTALGGAASALPIGRSDTTNAVAVVTTGSDQVIGPVAAGVYRLLAAGDAWWTWSTQTATPSVTVPTATGTTTALHLLAGLPAYEDLPDGAYIAIRQASESSMVTIVGWVREEDIA